MSPRASQMPTDQLMSNLNPERRLGKTPLLLISHPTLPSPLLSSSTQPSLSFPAGPCFYIQSLWIGVRMAVRQVRQQDRQPERGETGDSGGKAVITHTCISLVTNILSCHYAVLHFSVPECWKQGVEKDLKCSLFIQVAATVFTKTVHSRLLCSTSSWTHS